MNSPTEIITVVDLQNLLGELRGMARRLLSAESGHQSMTPTALAITALRRAKLRDQDWEDVRWENRSHFFGSLIVAMRHALTDRARRPHTKLQRKMISLPWDDSVLLNLPVEAEERPDRYIELDEALAKLKEMEPRLAEVIDLFYFGGYTVADIQNFSAADDGKKPSEKTVDRELKSARVLLEKLMKKKR